MAKELGYDQITGIVYTKTREGWYETFNLQASSYGNPFFYINYGVILPAQWPADRGYLKSAGWLPGRRLRYGNEGAFPCATKAEIEASAAAALDEYKRVACPWFESLTLAEIKRQRG